MRYLVIEYAPSLLSHEHPTPVRIDGHYDRRSTAEDVARLWVETPLGAETRIVVVEIQHTAKMPESWKSEVLA